MIRRENSSLREEVRPIKSEITIFDFQNFDFAKYVTLWCKRTKINVLSKIALCYSHQKSVYILIPIDASKYSQTHYK
jgi:hypothetical protein